MFNHPTPGDDVAKPLVKVLPPLHGVSTSSYKDVEVFLEWPHNTIIREQEYQVVVVFGDDQFVERLLNRLAVNYGLYRDILPFPGELHLQMHLCHTIMRLGYDEYLQPIANHLNINNITKNFLLKNWDKHDDFMLVVAQACVNWLTTVLPSNLKDASWEKICKLVEKNKHISKKTQKQCNKEVEKCL